MRQRFASRGVHSHALLCTLRYKAKWWRYAPARVTAMAVWWRISRAKAALWVGAWMVGQGYAWSYSYKNNAGPYEALQLQAQTQHLGLFSDGRALQPRWFRKRFGSCHLPTPDASH